MIDRKAESAEDLAAHPKPGGAHYAVLGAVCALVIGVYVWSARTGVLQLSAKGAEENYYNLLVEGFRDGQINLKRDVPPGLAQLADPYDPVANEPYRSVEGLHDLSYYHGKLYLYFGVTPALVLFWPYAALTGHYLIYRDGGMIFFSVGFLASAVLLWALWRRYFAGVRFGVMVLGTIALGLANFTPAILSWCKAHEVAISCGYALTMLALLALWCAWHQPLRRGRWLAVASLAYGLAVGARPSLLLGAGVLLLPVVQAWREKQRVWPPGLAALGPILLFGLGLMLYNALRFGDPLEFGQRYQLSGYRQGTMEQFSLGYLWTNFRVGFLEPARWSGRFPFVQEIAVPPLPRGYFEVVDPFGILANIPLVWLALAAPLAWRSRSAAARSILCWFLAAAALLFGTCALTLGLHNSMCLRYEVEFASPLVLLAVAGIFGLERALANRTAWRRATRCGWGVLLAFSVAFNLLATIASHAEAHNTLGGDLFRRGRMEEAVAQFQKAVKLQPDNARACHNLGMTLAGLGRVREAVDPLADVARLEPENVEARHNLGVALFRLGEARAAQGRWDEAIPQYERVVQLNPDNAQAHDSLGLALNRQGRYAEAVGHFQKALEINPKSVMALNNLAWVLATCGEASVRDGARAVELAAKASEVAGDKDAGVLDTLAAAYAEAGRFDDAVRTAQTAIELARGAGAPETAQRIQGRLESYRAGQPYHERLPTHLN